MAIKIAPSRMRLVDAQGMATPEFFRILQALQDRTGGLSGVMDASDVASSPTGDVAATNVQAAISELASEKATAANLNAHITDATDAHDASAISNVPAGGIAATTVQAAINELYTEKASDAGLSAHIGDTANPHAVTAAQVGAPSGSGTSTGTNTGDQTSIVGITGTIAEFSAACTDADFANVSNGTWTPTLTFATPGNLSVTYATRLGNWRIVGDQVTAWFDIVTSAFTHTTASGNLRIGGLGSAGLQALDTGPINVGTLSWSGITKAGYTSVVPTVDITGTVAEFLASGSGVAAASVTFSDCPTAGTMRLRGCITYTLWV